MNLPACCTAPLIHWPLPQLLPGAVLASNRFNPAELTPHDFLHCAIEAPASIQRSVIKRQAEFLAGRLCARSALEQLGVANYVPIIGDDRAPVWPQGLCGSITHGAGWAGAVVAHQANYRGLGLDMESIMPNVRARRLQAEILTAEELSRLDQLPAERIGLAVTLTFSLKESLFKALYPLVLRRFYFEHAEVMFWSEHGHARLRLLTDLSEEWHQGTELDAQFCVSDGHLLSLIAIPAL